MTLTITQFARMGGKARWRKLSKEARSKAMSKVRRKGLARKKLQELTKSRLTS